MSKVMQCNGCDEIAANPTLSSATRLFIVDMPMTGKRAERMGELKIGPDKKWKVTIRLDSSSEDLCRVCSQRLLACLSHQWLEPEEDEGGESEQS